MSLSTVSPSSSSSSEEEEEDYGRTAQALLKKEGFDPDDVSKLNIYGCTPMVYYSYMGNVTMVRYLIAHGADCRKIDRSGYSPMHWAAMYGHLEIIKLLSHDGGAHDDIRKVSNIGHSPLRVALDRGQSPSV